MPCFLKDFECINWSTQCMGRYPVMWQFRAGVGWTITACEHTTCQYDTICQVLFYYINLYNWLTLSLTTLRNNFFTVEKCPDPREFYIIKYIYNDNN